MKAKTVVELMTINPKEHIEPNLILDRQFDITQYSDKCYNCDTNQHNITHFLSAPWSSTYYCGSCDKIVVLWHQDQASGYEEVATVQVFKDKNDYIPEEFFEKHKSE